MSPGKISETIDKYRMTAEDEDRFYAFIDALPEREQVLFAFQGQKSSLWLQLGGGAKRIIGLFFNDRLVISTRGMVKVSVEKGHEEYPLSEISDIDIRTGALFSSVTIRFQNGSKTKIGNVDKRLAEVLSRYATQGIGAFDRSNLDLKTFNAMYFAYVLSGQPLPEYLKKSAA